MFHYWYHVIKILIARNFQKPIDIEKEWSREFRVGLLDCDGLRVMTAFKYAAYMDYIRWETIARSKLYNEIVLKGNAPTLGSQKIIYRKPLRRWTKFILKVEVAGWDDKWIYHIHKFEQNEEVKAVGITRALIWKRDKPQVLREILDNVGVRQKHKTTPDWILNLFNQDTEIIAGNLK